MIHNIMIDNEINRVKRKIENIEETLKDNTKSFVLKLLLKFKLGIIYKRLKEI